MKRKAIVLFTGLMIANLLIPMISACTVGLTQGYWKNYPKHAWPDGFNPDDKVKDWFPATDGHPYGEDTLIEALSYHGGPGLNGSRRILLRAAVACLLSQYYFDQSAYDKQYPVDVVSWCWNAPRSNIINRAAELDGYNNLGPPST